MNLSIRHWLVENYIEISQIKECSQGQITSIAWRIIQSMEVKSPSLFNICTLAEVLELPIEYVWHSVGVFARLTTSILSLLKPGLPLNRNQATWFAFQVAYLQALEEVLIEEASLSRVWLERGFLCAGKGEKGEAFANYLVKPLPDERLQGLIKILREEKLSDVKAEEALLRVANSSFVQQMNSVAVAWLVANSVLEVEAELIIQRLNKKLLGHLIVVVSENAAILVQIQKFFKLGNSVEFQTTGINYPFNDSNDNIDFNKEKYRASLIKKLGEPLLIEYFSVKDIYIPPNGLPLEGNHQPVDLMKWVVSQLDDTETITVIESESGCGKTSFCQILAARIARKLYPEWMPVHINLSEIFIGDNFIETLQSAFCNNFEINLAAWLKESQTKYLLILDGFNELPDYPEDKMAIAIFLEQLVEFQWRFKHKIILTSQNWALEDILCKVALKLRRIKIQPWGQDEWKLWFANWATVQSMEVSHSFFKFLKKHKAFSKKSHFLLSDLVRQPLMLYLLGVLHRDELLDDDILQSSTNPQITNGCVVLWKIYERLNQWLLGYPVRSLSQKILASSIYTHIHRTPEAVNSLVKNRHPQTLVNQMQAVALQILHSRKTKIKLQTDSNQLPAFYFKAIATHIEQNTSTTKINSAPDSAFNIKFTHAKFGEYLCAASIVEKLAALTKHSRNNYGEIIFAIDSPQEIAQYLYQLLGYGILTQEIEELIIEGLAQKQNHKFSFELLCNRLQSFWYAYSAGRWLDEGIAHKVWADFKQLRNYLNVEQVNAAVGINVFLLLSACYKKTKRSFSPCSNPFSATEFHPQAFTKLIAKTALFNSDLTRQRISQKSLTFLNLAKADLRQTMLAGFNFANANLANVQLKDACLTGANLADVNLTGANLTNANLTNANLTNAKLTGANLTGANLLGVNLDLVNLSNTCLFQAIITDNQKETAITNGAVFSLDKFEELKRLLSYQSQADGTNGGERTEIAFQVGESSPMEKQNPIIGHIESAEGEPIMSLDLDDYREDETVLRSSDFE